MVNGTYIIYVTSHTRTQKQKPHDTSHKLHNPPYGLILILLLLLRTLTLTLDLDFGSSRVVVATSY